MDLPRDDLIIEKFSWKSSVFHRYKSDLKKYRHEQKIDCLYRVATVMEKSWNF